MAYAYRRSIRRRAPRRKGRTSRRTARRPAYRRPRRTRTSKRYVNNVASRKLFDTMPPWSDIVDNISTSAFAGTGATFQGGTTQAQTVLWQASARDGLANDNSKLPSLAKGRHRTTVFLKGVREQVKVATNTAQHWMWRRVVFSVKNNAFSDGVDPDSAAYFRRTADGYKRLIVAAPLSTLYNLIFKGTDQDDWVDPILAPLNNDRITVHYNKRIQINPGAEAGKTMVHKMWHGMNKNLVYDDKELGDDVVTTPYAAQGRYGLGNVYIVDMFQPGYGSGTEDNLEFTVNSTLYWHEK